MIVGQPTERNFYPRPPCGGRPITPQDGNTRQNFYPRPPCGGRPAWVDLHTSNVLFLSTPSVWRATVAVCIGADGGEISIHALRVEGDRGFWNRRLHAGISIHALRVEGDPGLELTINGDQDFYPRPPCGGRHTQNAYEGTTNIFLSTPSVWRATVSLWVSFTFSRFLSTPSVWRATVEPHNVRTCQLISIHALRVEGDAAMVRNGNGEDYFYPRPPCGGRRQSRQTIAGTVPISIHALRVEGDNITINAAPGMDVFLSTPSVWRATYCTETVCMGYAISIHALRVEGDAGKGVGEGVPDDFYPRPPCGGRRGNRGRCLAGKDISIHALRVEGDALLH